MNDPAWDMPKENWAQQGSFEVGEVPPDTDPDGGSMVCLPPINVAWLPFVLGCLDQMRNPSSWIVSDNDAMYAVLSRVDRLKQMIGERAPCFMYQMRFTDTCLLQFSTDGGTTWTDVDGWADQFPICNPPQTALRFTPECKLQGSTDGSITWDTIPGWSDNFGNCVQENTPIIGLPPNPGDKAPDVLACAIAGYLAQSVVLDSIQAAVTNINNDLTLLGFGANVLTLIPEFVLVAAAYDAFASIYAIVKEGTLSDFEAALADPTLIGLVTCAIYNAIVGDGYVTPANFAAILSNVGAITYTYSDVISAIVAYLTALGATGLAQLSQIAGLGSGTDCGTCGAPTATWGFLFDTTGAVGTFAVWTLLDGTLDSGGIKSIGSGGDQFLHASITIPAQVIDGWKVTYNRVVEGNGGSSFLQAILAATSVGVTAADDSAGPHTVEQDLLIDVDTLLIALDSSQRGTAGQTAVSSVWIWGKGTCPFGTPNYHYPP